MKKILKVIGKVILGIVIIVLLLGLGLFSYHKIQSAKEEKYLEPLGEFVEVDGHNISVYTEGTGEKTLVFLQGGGMPSPILESKSLYSLLSDDYRIVVIERPGYGFSDEVEGIPSLNTILDWEREAIFFIMIGIFDYRDDFFWSFAACLLKRCSARSSLLIFLMTRAANE